MALQQPWGVVGDVGHYTNTNPSSFLEEAAQTLGFKGWEEKAAGERLRQGGQEPPVW